MTYRILFLYGSKPILSLVIKRLNEGNKAYVCITCLQCLLQNFQTKYHYNCLNIIKYR